MISFSFQAPCTSLVATPNASDIYDLDSCVRRFIACMWGDSKDNGSPAGVWKIAISARSTVSSLACCVHGLPVFGDSANTNENKRHHDSLHQYYHWQ